MLPCPASVVHLLIPIVANGLVSGLLVALMALAFAIVYVPTRVFHVALGATYVGAPLVAWALVRGGFAWIVAVPFSVAAGAAFSALCEVGNHGPLERRAGSSTAHFISSLGISIVAVQAMATCGGSETKVLRPGLDALWLAGPLALSRSQVIAAAVSASVLTCYFLFLYATRTGLLLRGLADNSREMALLGYNVSRLRIAAFAVSGLIASVAGLLAAFDVGFDPHGGLPAFLLGVVAVMLGGRLSFAGPVLAAIAVGLLRGGVAWLWSSRWQDVVTFGLFAIFLLVRPDGVFGTPVRAEAET